MEKTRKQVLTVTDTQTQNFKKKILYSFAGAVVTKYHKLGLKQQVPHVSEA